MPVSLHVYVVFLTSRLTVLIQFYVLPDKTKSRFWFLEDMPNISDSISLFSLWHIGLKNWSHLVFLSEFEVFQLLIDSMILLNFK